MLFQIGDKGVRIKGVLEVERAKRHRGRRCRERRSRDRSGGGRRFLGLILGSRRLDGGVGVLIAKGIRGGGGINNLEGLSLVRRPRSLYDNGPSGCSAWYSIP